MNQWTTNIDNSDEQEGVFSLADNQSQAGDPPVDHTQSQAPQSQEPYVPEVAPIQREVNQPQPYVPEVAPIQREIVQPTPQTAAPQVPTSQPTPHPSVQPQPQAQPQPATTSADPNSEQISQLGSYQISDVTVAKKSSKPFATWILALVIIIPIVFIFSISALSGGKEEESDAFLFNTLESEYFTMTTRPGYAIQSVVDKKVPFVERHILNSDEDGQKTLTIIIKDVQFDYKVEENSGARARSQNAQLYDGWDYELHNKQGTYFKKTDENFEHYVVLVDRNRSVLYEILFESPTRFWDDEAMGVELKEILKSVTFL